jgi:hypothetical protein
MIMFGSENGRFGARRRVVDAFARVGARLSSAFRDMEPFTLLTVIDKS